MLSLRRKKNTKKKNQEQLLEDLKPTSDTAADTTDSFEEGIADNTEETTNTEWDSQFWSESEESWSEQPLVLGSEECSSEEAYGEEPEPGDASWDEENTEGPEPGDASWSEENIEGPEPGDASWNEENSEQTEPADSEQTEPEGKKGKKKKDKKKDNKKDNRKRSKRVSRRQEQDVRKFTKVAKFRGIRTKLIGAFLIPVCLFIVVGIIIYNKSSDGLQDNAEELTYTSVDMLREYFELGFENIELSATRLSVSEDICMHFTGLYGRDYEIASKGAIVNEAVADRYISSIFVFGSEVKNIVTNEGVKKKTLYDDFVASEEGKKVEEKFKESGDNYCWIGSHPSADEVLKINESDYSLALVKQLLDSRNRPCGYIVIDVKTSFIQEILDNASVGDKAIKAFVTSDGRQVISGSEDMDMCSQSFYQDIVDEEGGYKYITYDGEEYLFLYSKTKTGDGIVTAMVPKTVILEKAYEIRNYTIITIIACCLIAVLCGSMLALGIAKTIRKVNAVMKQTSEGDLTGNLKINRKDEFRVLAGNIMNMITSIKGLIVKMTKVSSQVNESSNQVGDNSEVLYKATKDITEAIGYIEAGLIQQSEDTENCMNQMSDLSERINVVSGRTSEIGNIAIQTQETVNNGMVIVKELGSRVQDTTEITKAIIEDIGQLEKESKAINSIIATINEIADETNLLSLNATIEAARAGEAGRGFAVVSAEIRKLAEQSAAAGTQIKGIIAQIQARMAQTIATAERAEDIVNYQAESLNTTVKVFEDIRSQVEILTTDLETISDNINGIENLKNDTLDAIASISATSNQTEAASTELTKSAERQMKAVEELNEAVSQLQVNSTELDESVSIFKVGNAIIEEMDSAQDTLTETPYEESLNTETPYEETPNEEESYEESPYEEAPNEETPYEESLNTEAPYEEAPYEEGTGSSINEIPSLEDFPEEDSDKNE